MTSAFEAHANFVLLLRLLHGLSLMALMISMSANWTLHLLNIFMNNSRMVAVNRLRLTHSTDSWLYPELKYQLPRAAQAQRGWAKLFPGQSYPPLTWELAVTIAVQLARNGNTRHGIGVVLAFDCLLRVSELVALRREDVMDSGDARAGFEHRGTMLLLRHTKTGKNKSVAVLDPSVIELLRGLVRTTAPGARLFPFSAASFRRSLKGTCAHLGLSARYVPHSLRHGGATRYYHVFGWSVEDVMERGRWASTKSAKLYIQSGVALLGAIAVPPAVARMGMVLVRDIVFGFALAAARARDVPIS